MLKSCFGLLALGLVACGTPRAQHQSLRNEIAQLAQATSGKVGVSIRVLETNDTLSYRDHQPYVLQSVFKLAIAMAVLHEQHVLLPKNWTV